MKNGFTLIELLAVIVILAIIALIATPIVLGIINDSKNSATIRSAGYYIEAVKHAIMKKNLELQVPIDPKECTVISNSYIKCDEVELEVEVEGELPDSGSITFESGKTINVELTYGERKIVKNSNGELVLETNSQVCKLISGEPNVVGSKYECEVKPGTKYNFYVLSHEEDGTTNLIMDSNICEDGTLTAEGKNCTVKYNETGNAAGVGPVTAMNYLNNATSTWANISNLNITYDDEGDGYDGSGFTNFKIEGKARLPYKKEISNYDGTNAYLYSNLELSCTNHPAPGQGTEVSCDSNDAFVYGVDDDSIEHIKGVYGYWSLSTWAPVTSHAFPVDYGGNVYHNSVDCEEYGVRPVINVKL